MYQCTTTVKRIFSYKQHTQQLILVSFTFLLVSLSSDDCNTSLWHSIRVVLDCFGSFILCIFVFPNPRVCGFGMTRCVCMEYIMRYFFFVAPKILVDRTNATFFGVSYFLPIINPLIECLWQTFPSSPLSLFSFYNIAHLFACQMTFEQYSYDVCLVSIYIILLY